jgi:hypothetical protein
MKRLAVTVMLATAWIGSARAVQPQLWLQQSEKDFAQADRSDTVVDTHGDVTLARKVEILLPGGKAPTVVGCLAVDGKTIYAGSGSDGQIWKLTDGQAPARPWASIPATFVSSLAVCNGQLLAGGGGDGAGLYAIDADGKARVIYQHQAVRYIWAIELLGDSLYLATGPDGRVVRIDVSLDKSSAEVVYEARELAKNILSLDAESAGTLLAGTDTTGLVLRIDPVAKTAHVLLDASEAEVPTVLSDGAGGAWVITGDVSKVNGKDTPTGGKTGRADPAETDEPAAEEDDAPADEKQAAEAPAETSTPASAPADQAASAPADAPEPSQPQALAAQAQVPQNISASGGAGAAADEPAQAVADEKTQLRRTIAKRLANKQLVVKARGSRSRGSSGPAGAAAPSGQGNAVYHIDSEGIVTTLLRRPVMFYDMVRRGDRLELATGPDGRILFVTLDGQLAGEVADISARQVTSLATMPDGLAFATANAGAVGVIGSDLARKGTLVSKPHDAGQIAQWGTVRLVYSALPKTKLSISTRSGNVADPDKGGWSSWSKDSPAESGYLPIGSPAGRFLQYRLTLRGDGKASPVAGGVEVIFQVPNLPPTITAVTVEAVDKDNSTKQPTKLYREIKIAAADPNKDTLQFEIQARPLDDPTWVAIARELDKPEYTWDTRTAADGRYELRVIASDSPSNPVPAARQVNRLSEPLTVDNTPPGVDDLQMQIEGRGVAVSGQARDATSRIVAMSYAVDSATKWTPFLPADGLCDSPAERFGFEIDKLTPGPHRITLRIEDLYGNAGYVGRTITIKGGE